LSKSKLTKSCRAEEEEEEEEEKTSLQNSINVTNVDFHSNQQNTENVIYGLPRFYPENRGIFNYNSGSTNPLQNWGNH